MILSIRLAGELEAIYGGDCMPSDTAALGEVLAPLVASCPVEILHPNGALMIRRSLLS